MLEGPILLALLVFAIELARLREHTLNARRRGRAAKELPCHLGKNRQAVLLTILSFPPGQHIQVDVFLDRQREVLIKLVLVDLERRLGGLLDVHRRHGQVKKGPRRSMLEVVCGRALAAPASRRSAAASTADGSDVRKPAASRGPGACTVLYRCRRISGYPTIRDIRRLFHGIWIYLEHPHQLSVSTRWQNGHYPVNPDCAGANRIHSLIAYSFA